MIKLEAFRIKESEDKLCMIAWQIAEVIQGYRIILVLPNMTMICRICQHLHQLMEVSDSLVVVLVCNLLLLFRDTAMLPQWGKMLFKNNKRCPFQISTWINQLARPRIYPAWEEASKCHMEINQSISCRMQSNARLRNSPVKTSTFRREWTHLANLETIINIWWWVVSITLRSVLSMVQVLVAVRDPLPQGWVLCPKRSIAWTVASTFPTMLPLILINPAYWMILYLAAIPDSLVWSLQQQWRINKWNAQTQSQTSTTPARRSQPTPSSLTSTASSWIKIKTATAHWCSQMASTTPLIGKSIKIIWARYMIC